tara:strand:+ start:63 stop:383 length:321 start_codon:yes stop_codon:yes gene_type:complete
MPPKKDMTIQEFRKSRGYTNSSQGAQPEPEKPKPKPKKKKLPPGSHRMPDGSIMKDKDHKKKKVSKVGSREALYKKAKQIKDKKCKDLPISKYNKTQLYNYISRNV